MFRMEKASYLELCSPYLDLCVTSKKTRPAAVPYSLVRIFTVCNILQGNSIYAAWDAHTGQGHCYKALWKNAGFPVVGFTQCC